MAVKIYVSNEDRQEVARKLLDAADNPTDVRLEKTRGIGFVITDELAEKLNLTGKTLEPSAPNTLSLDSDDADVKPADSPKQGRPRGNVSKKGNAHNDR
jgi:hypothetical protein